MTEAVDLGVEDPMIDAAALRAVLRVIMVAVVVDSVVATEWTLCQGVISVCPQTNLRHFTSPPPYFPQPPSMPNGRRPSPIPHGGHRPIPL